MVHRSIQYDFVSTRSLLRRGLELLGHNMRRQLRTCTKTKLERFRAGYGVGPKALAACFHELQRSDVDEARISRPQLDYFLIAVYWMKTYRAEALMAGDFGQDEKTLREHIRRYICAISKLVQLKIKWPDDNGEEIYFLSVDGVHFLVREPRSNPTSKWMSYKHKAAGLCYEIGLSIYENQIVWINGPFKASTHDKKIFDEFGLGEKIPDGKLAVTDRGYRKSRFLKKIAMRNRFDSSTVKWFKRRVRARHENANERLKSFRVLRNRFRHNIELHQTVMEAACVLVQYDMENGHPLMDIYFDGHGDSCNESLDSDSDDDSNDDSDDDSDVGVVVWDDDDDDDDDYELLGSDDEDSE